MFTSSEVKTVYKCLGENCGYSTIDSTASSEHMNTCLLHKCKNYSCEVKGSHEAVSKHTTTCEYTRLLCTVCEYYILRRDYKIHEGKCSAKVHACELCNETFKISTDLTEHNIECLNEHVKAFDLMKTMFGNVNIEKVTDYREPHIDRYWDASDYRDLENQKAMAAAKIRLTLAKMLSEQSNPSNIQQDYTT